MIYIAVAIGAFYVFAGFVVMRAMAMDQLMNRILFALENKKDPKEEWKTAALTVGAFLTLASGAALMLLSPLATILFVANAIVQGGYVLWADRALPPEDESEKKGRQQTKNALVIYLAATAFVIWLATQDLLRPWLLQPVAIDAVIIMLGTAAAWGWIHLPRGKSEASGSSPLDSFAETAGIAPTGTTPPQPTRLRFAPEWHCSPIWDADTGDSINVFELDLPEDLVARIEEWDTKWQATYNDNDPAAGGYQSVEEQEAYVREGRELARELERVWPGIVQISEGFR